MIKFGNHKLGDDTAIFNMSSAEDCPSKRLNLCRLPQGVKCYALKAEQQYKPVVTNFRKNQESWWRDTEISRIIEGITRKIKQRRKDTKYLRFNESGDFANQEDIAKLSQLSIVLRDLGVTCYGYTARSDLDYSNAKFLVKGSGWSGPNGKTIVINKTDPVPEGYLVCPGSCKTCNLCKIDVPHNIAFRKH